MGRAGDGGRAERAVRPGDGQRSAGGGEVHAEGMGGCVPGLSGTEGQSWRRPAGGLRAAGPAGAGACDHDPVRGGDHRRIRGALR